MEEELNKLLAESKIAEVLKRLEQILPRNHKLESERIRLSGLFTAMEEKKRLGLANQETLSVEYNKVFKGLQDLVKQLSSAHLFEPSTGTPVRPRSVPVDSNSTTIIATLMVVLLLAGTLIGKNFINKSPIKSRMEGGDRLKPEEQITSPNRLYRFIYQEDGNLVLYKGRAVKF